MDSEKALIQGCIKGDRKAQKLLYDQYAGRMLVVAMRYSKSDLEAEDIIQEAFIKIFEKIKTFREESRLGFWIKRIVVNTALNHQRSKLYMFPMVDVQELNNSADGEFSLSGYHFKELLGFIKELPSGCQIIFNLYAIEGYSHQEIAKMLDVSVGTSKSQYFRAKELLKARIGQEEQKSYERVR
ncbi:RNA polymerase sigma factor [Fulvivirga lutimaris]|uniref:RNA polymerase sigma factor n=1 Tax=Fulvivirga lutimaris TaxID=1819566 RepID=UPI0012BD26B4|nr:RNA polymerase sigma factor [Fulvivirga lutimaris]MTI40849.1 RNA polymerase sigma factor [Fulvivirga lutimaris]